jgi:hypothetical protein
MNLGAGPIGCSGRGSSSPPGRRGSTRRARRQAWPENRPSDDRDRQRRQHEDPGPVSKELDASGFEREHDFARKLLRRGAEQPDSNPCTTRRATYASCASRI